MKRCSMKGFLSFVLSLCMVLTTVSGVTLPTSAVVSGTDENGFSYTSDGESVTITGYTPRDSFSGVVRIPAEIDGVPVRTIGGMLL